MNYKKLGDYINEKVEFNEENKYDLLQGVSNNKYFQKAKTNTIGVDLSKYRVAHYNQFVFNRATTRNGDKISIALRKGESCIVSPSYRIFEVKDENILNPDYLLMWFKRPEFDRYARFKSHGSAHEFFDMDEMNDVELPIPSIEKQREIVGQYQAVENKIKVNEQICEQLEATAQTVYKQWFVDFEFPCLLSGYRPHGQVNQNLPIDEYITKIGSVCTYSRVGGLPVLDGKTWFVYLILCENDSVYKGITNDLYRRFYEHYMGEGAEWTKLNKPLKVIHWESFATKEEAAKREKDLKTGYGRTWISRQIEKAGGITQLKTSLPAPQTELRTAGKMVFNEELEKEIPEGWEVIEFQKITDVTSGKSIKNPNGTKYPIYGAGGITGFTDDYLFDENIIVIGRVGTHGKVFIEYDKSYPSDNTLVFTPKYLIYSYFVLKHLNYDELNKGGVQALLTQSDLKALKILEPNFNLNEFETRAEKFMIMIDKIDKQNQKLTQLQSLLLSRLATLEG